MRRYLAVLLAGLSLYVLPASVTAARADQAASPQGTKEWTFLVFINGHNNLDRYGAINLNQMEQVGSTKDVNVVVQWASQRNGTTKRLYVTKDNDTSKVTSPVVQDMGAVDMGDWRNIVEFVKWGHDNYPAKKYFLALWDHGSGWHAIQMRGASGNAPSMPIFPMDISWDDNSGNSITTQQLGTAIKESAKVLGQKIDLFASDACLMAMAEVANEMSESVEIFAGSEEVEPAAGWPYDQVLRRWAAAPQSSAAEVAKILTAEYVKSYSGGQNGTQDVTFSAFDLSKMNSFNQAMTTLGGSLLKLDADGRKKISQAIDATMTYTYSDYGDLGDFVSLMGRTRFVDTDVLGQVQGAINDFVIANQATGRYSRSKGVAIWLPSTKNTYREYIDLYKPLQFDTTTGWSNALQHVLQDGANLQ